MPQWNNQVALAAAVALALTVSLGLTIVLGRTLSPAALGFVALIGAVLAMARDMTELGSGTVAAARIADTPGSEAAILDQVLGLRLVLAVLASLGCLALALRPERADEQAVLALTAAAVLLMPLGTLAIVFQARHQPLQPVLIGLAAQLAAAAACIALAVLPGIAAGSAVAVGAAIAALQVLREAATALAVWRAGTRRLGWWPRPRWVSRELLREIGGYGLAALCFGLAVQGSPVLVGLAGPPGALEAYAAERSVSLLTLAIGGLAAQPAVASVISGATRPEQVAANVQAGLWEPSAEDLAGLDAIRVRPEFSYTTFA